jgi:hypothetical protein
MLFPERSSAAAGCIADDRIATVERRSPRPICLIGGGFSPTLSG